ncbi:hypothetical protein HUW62_12010 [Myxococcus sp. AM011]|uniref:hypothetical protein n=1 Tax=Myxococcus sp. AM011 TaxID=2745200 RepID=UPI0015961005|nr:hypothetical protein [Myxococcus sp. AM011]NVJ21944.1 hypothetical protein [Myxococcus sp. AM011]
MRNFVARVLVLWSLVVICLLPTRSHAQLLDLELSLTNLTVLSALGFPQLSTVAEIHWSGLNALPSLQLETTFPTGWAPATSTPGCSVSGNAVTCEMGAIATGGSATTSITTNMPLLTVGVNHPITTRLLSGNNPANTVTVTRYCTAITSLIIICD